MSNIIITIIGIVLAAAILLLGLNYTGGNADKAQVTAQATKYLNESQMISGAYTIYTEDNHGTPPSGISDMVAANYIKEPPSNDWVVSSGTTVAEATNIPEAVCKEINNKLGVGATIPQCTTPGLPNSVCCI